MMVSKINFQILIATMNRGNLDFLYKMFPSHKVESLDIIIVNQTSPDKIVTSHSDSIKVINSFEKGLSKSRNLALKNATSDWCLIADDDVIYTEKFENSINSGIEKYNNSGVIIFESLVCNNVLRRRFPKNTKQKLTAFERFDVASFEMLLNRTTGFKVFFNENFGLGSDVFLCGEEALVMYDYCVRGTDVSFYKQPIVFHPKESTGVIYDHPLRYFTKGGMLKYMYPKSFKSWIFVQLFFDIKQNKISVSDVIKNYKEAIRGVKKINEITHAAN